MIKKIKASTSEKFIFIFLILLSVITFCTYFIVKNKCLFVKDIDPKDMVFEKPNNIAILNAPCGNVIIELYPNISPNACLLYTSDAADDSLRVDLGGRRIIKK